MSLDELIKAAELAKSTLRERLDATDLDSLLQQVVYLRARRKTPVLPEDEAQLLLRINRGIPADLLAQYQLLRQNREAETLTGGRGASPRIHAWGRACRGFSHWSGHPPSCLRAIAGL